MGGLAPHAHSGVEDRLAPSAPQKGDRHQFEARQLRWRAVGDRTSNWCLSPFEARWHLLDTRPRKSERKPNMIVNGPGISFTEPDIGAEFVPPIPENPRPKIVALCEHCTNRLLGKKELKPFEYWAFAEVTTDEMADVLLKMKMRRPYTLPELVKATGLPEADLEKLLDEMSYIGLIEYNWENPDRAKQWVLPMLVPGSAEFLNMRQSQIDEHPAVAKFFEQASKGALARATPMVPPGGAGIGMHVIPVEKAIEMEDRSVSIEHIEHWLDKYDGKYAASACSCRMSRAKLGEGCGDDPNDWCIAVGDMADYVVETDRGRYITREEVYDTLRQAEANGFVHQITNIDGEDKIFAICNCNVNVCYALRTSQLFNTPNLSRSAYVARTETDKCVACGRCVEVLPRRRRQARPEALRRQHGQGAGVSQAGASGCREVGSGEVEPRLPQQEPHRDLRHRHLSVQDRLPGAHRRPGLPQARRAGSLSRRARPHQAREPAARDLRPHLQPPLRGRLHPRPRRRRGGHRRGEEVHRRPGPRGGEPLRARGRDAHAHGRLRRQDRGDRRRSRRPVLCVLPGREGLQAGHLREERSPRRHAHLRHPALQAREGGHRGRGRHHRGDGRRDPLRRGGRSRPDPGRAARSGLQGLLCGDRLPGRPSARHPGPGRRGRVRGRRLPAPRCRAAGERRRGGRHARQDHRGGRRQRRHRRCPHRRAPGQRARRDVLPRERRGHACERRGGHGGQRGRRAHLLRLGPGLGRRRRGGPRARDRPSSAACASSTTRVASTRPTTRARPARSLPTAWCSPSARRSSGAACWTARP